MVTSKNVGESNFLSTSCGTFVVNDDVEFGTVIVNDTYRIDATDNGTAKNLTKAKTGS